MAFWFGDGYDCYSVLTDCGTYWDATFGGTTTLSISASGRFAGSRGLTNPSGVGTAAYITKTSGQNDAVHHIIVALQQTALSGTNAIFYINLFDGATAQCTIVFRSDGAILLTSGLSNGTTLATYTGAVAAINTWYAFEIEVVINNTTGSISFRKNGNTSNDFSLGSLNTRATANNYANKIGLGSGSSSSTVTIDDFLWRSDASTVPWIGDVRCWTRMPATDASVAWSRSGSAVPVTPFVQGSTPAVSNTIARFFPVTVPADGTVGTISISLGSGYTGNMKCSIFSNSGGNTPGTVLGSATPVSNPATGSNIFTFGTPVAVTRGTQYWVGTISDTASGTYNATASALTGATQSATTYAAFPVANPTTSVAGATIGTVNITPTSAPNGAFVADIQQDAAASYVYSSTVSQSDLYGIAAISSTPSTIVGVTTRAYCQKSDAGTRNIAVQLQSGATNVQSASTALPAGSWQWVSRTDLVDPATSAPWTATSVNNVTIGVVVTA